MTNENKGRRLVYSGSINGDLPSEVTEDHPTEIFTVYDYSESSGKSMFTVEGFDYVAPIGKKSLDSILDRLEKLEQRPNQPEYDLKPFKSFYSMWQHARDKDAEQKFFNELEELTDYLDDNFEQI